MNLFKKLALAALILSFFVNNAMAVGIVPECAVQNITKDAIYKFHLDYDDLASTITDAMAHFKRYYACKDTPAGEPFYTKTRNACDKADDHGRDRRAKKMGVNAKLCVDNFNAWRQAIIDTINEPGCKAVSADTPVTAVLTPGAACACRNKYQKDSKDKQSYDPTKSNASSPNATYTYLIGLTSRTSEQENCCKVMNGLQYCKSSTP